MTLRFMQHSLNYPFIQSPYFINHLNQITCVSVLYGEERLNPLTCTSLRSEVDPLFIRSPVPYRGVSRAGFVVDPSMKSPARFLPILRPVPLLSAAEFSHRANLYIPAHALIHFLDRCVLLRHMTFFKRVPDILGIRVITYGMGCFQLFFCMDRN